MLAHLSAYILSIVHKISINIEITCNLPPLSIQVVHLGIPHIPTSASRNSQIQVRHYNTPCKLYQLTCRISAVHTFCGNIFQLYSFVSFTPPGTGPTGNLYHGFLERRFGNACPISTKLGIEDMPLKKIPTPSLFIYYNQ
jgi:hypothetical protein